MRQDHVHRPDPRSGAPPGMIDQGAGAAQIDRLDMRGLESDDVQREPSYTKLYQAIHGQENNKTWRINDDCATERRKNIDLFVESCAKRG